MITAADLRGEDTDWTDQAACAGRNLDDWYPTSTDTIQTITARSICYGCPVRLACLNFAVKAEAQSPGLYSRYGIFGGLGPRQRAQYARGDRDVFRVPTFPRGHPRDYQHVGRDGHSRTYCRECKAEQVAA